MNVAAYLFYDQYYVIAKLGWLVCCAFVAFVLAFMFFCEFFPLWCRDQRRQCLEQLAPLISCGQVQLQVQSLPVGITYSRLGPPPLPSDSQLQQRDLHLLAIITVSRVRAVINSARRSVTSHLDSQLQQCSVPLGVVSIEIDPVLIESEGSDSRVIPLVKESIETAQTPIFPMVPTSPNASIITPASESPALASQNPVSASQISASAAQTPASTSQIPSQSIMSSASRIPISTSASSTPTYHREVSDGPHMTNGDEDKSKKKPHTGMGSKKK